MVRCKLWLFFAVLGLCPVLQCAGTQDDAVTIDRQGSADGTPTTLSTNGWRSPWFAFKPPKDTARVFLFGMMD